MYYAFWRRGGQSQFLKLLFGNIGRAIKIKTAKPADYYRQNGPQECARRRRQIERGILQVTPNV